MDVDILKEIIDSIVFFVKPFIGKSIGIIVVCYGVIFYVKKITKHTAPKWLKASIPLVLGVIAQAIQPTMISRDTANVILYNVLIGLAHGAVLSSIYDVVLKNIGAILLQKISGKKQ